MTKPRSNHLFWILPLACAFFAGAAESISPEETFAAWLQERAGTKTWEADFTQTRWLKTLVNPLISTGHVWFAAPSDFRWELGSPALSIAIRHGTEFAVVYPKLERIESYSLAAAATGPMGDAMSLLEAGFPNSRQDLEAKFKLLSVAATNGMVHVTMEPRAIGAKRYLPRLRLEIAATNHALTGTELQFSDGSRLRNDFTNPRTGPDIPPRIFSLENFKGFKQTNPMQGMR